MLYTGGVHMEDTAEQDPVPPLRVGIAYNLKKNNRSEAPDDEAEYDSLETVLAIQDALACPACQVGLLEATADFPDRLVEYRPDIVFNIAEGVMGRGREAQVPAILNFLKIPFTGSDETTLCLALDKALTKRVLSTYQVRTPKYRVIAAERPDLRGGFAFPAIVKPNAEGSSKGISDVAIVRDRRELRSLIDRNLRLYRQDMLVEEYIAGREFTVGIIGNGGEARVFPPMEIIYLDSRSQYQIYSYSVKQNYKQLIRYECPAAVNPELEAALLRTALKVFQVLKCRDFARIDFRVSQDGLPYFIEINPLPGLAPGYSDFPMLAAMNKMDYVTLVRGVLQSALRRYGLAYDLWQG